jgi:glycosyltransferase involved in cell wall biosynthesis
MSVDPVLILMLGAHPYKVKGGVSSWARNILASDLDGEFRIQYVATMADGPWIIKLGWMIRALGIFLFFLIAKRVKLVHIHGSKNASFYRKLFFIALAKVWKKKVIFHCHSGKFDQFYLNGPAWQKSLIRWVLSVSDRIVVLSPQWIAFFSELAPMSKLTILENAVSLDYYQSKGLDISRTAEPTLLFAGLLTENKGIFDLLSILPELIAQIPSARLLLAGSGDVKRIAAAVKEYDLEEAVTLAGWVAPETLLSFYHQAHLFVLPSYYEGLPMVMLEAMACGLPIVSTKVGGIPELIEEGENGYLIHPGDRKALLQALMILLPNHPLREAMGRNNIRKIREKYDLPMYIQKLKSLYLEVLGEHYE